MGLLERKRGIMAQKDGYLISILERWILENN